MCVKIVSYKLVIVQGCTLTENEGRARATIPKTTVARPKWRSRGIFSRRNLIYIYIHCIHHNISSKPASCNRPTLIFMANFVKRSPSYLKIRMFVIAKANVPPHPILVTAIPTFYSLKTKLLGVHKIKYWNLIFYGSWKLIIQGMLHCLKRFVILNIVSGMSAMNATTYAN